ncbi:MAG TPA: response regulator [Pyrinomonadaceae bacterium]|nr:response regulator [Pyrinomonadaceae bacterium]
MSVSPGETTTVAKRDFSSRTQPPGKPTILIVEDHDDTRELLRTLYEMWGCRVVEACNGLEAVDAASREHPALILMDGNLPFLDGLGATRRIRENRLLDDVRIVAVTGWGSTSYATAALDAGCNDFLLKPFEFQRLKDYLVSFLFVLQPNQKEH